MTPFEEIRRFLTALRSSLRRVALGEAMLTSWTLVLATVMVGLALAFMLGAGPGRWGWVPVGLGVMGAGVAAYQLWWHPRRATRTPEQLAHYVEARVGDLHAGVITGVQVEDLLRRDHSQGHRLGFSPELARASAERTAERLRGVTPQGLAEASRLQRLTWVALTLTLLVGVAGVTMPEVFVEGARALTESPPLPPEAQRPGEEIVDVAVGDMSQKLIFPAYMELQPRHVERSSGDVAAVSGTEVQFAGTALVPAETVVMVLESAPDGRWPLELGAEGTVRGALRVGESDRYQFVVTRPDGVIVRERVWRHIDAKADVEPSVKLLLPEADVEVHGGDQVSVLFEASDDYGLDRIELVTEPSDGGTPTRRVVRSSKGERTARGSDAVAVGELGLKAGDSIDVFFEAFDRNTVTGPGVGRSESRRITMYSPEAEHEALLGDLEKLIERMIDVLADRLESPLDERRGSELLVYVALHRRINVASAAVLRSFEAVLATMSTDPLATDALRDGLRKSFDRLSDVHEQETSSLDKATRRDVISPRASVSVSLLHAVNEEASTILEDAILDLKDLVDKARQDKLLAEGREMLDLQDELGKLLQQLKDGAGDDVKRQAAKKLEELERSLKQMNEEMGKLAEQVPYENQNVSQEPSGSQMDMQDLKDKIAKAKKLLEEGKIDEAMKLLEELNQATQQMVASLQNDFPGGRPQLSAQGQKAASEMQQKLNQVADGQRGLAQETEQLGQEQQEAAQQQMKQALEGARQQAQQIREKLDGVDGQPLHEGDKAQLESLRDGAQQLEKKLAEGDLEGAAEQAKQLGQGADGLQQEIGQGEQQEMDMKRSEGMRQAGDKVGESGKEASQLAEQLAQMKKGQGQPGEGKPGADGQPKEAASDMPPPPGSPPGKGGPGGKQSQQLGQRQSGLRKDLKGVRDQLTELDKELPGAKQQLDPLLDEAGQSMEKAERDLQDGKKAGDAKQHQDDALEKLGEAMQQMEERFKRSEREGGENDRAGVNDPERKVAIPQEDDYSVPKAFRDEILKAMREKAPPQYRKQIERFYKELVK